MITKKQWTESVSIIKEYAIEYYGFDITEKEILDEMLNRTIIAQCICEDKKAEMEEV